MSELRHTPGPWETDFRFGYRTLVQTPGRYPIAVTDILPRASGERAEQEANARLIAAAPDLLEALKELLGMAELFVPADLEAPGFNRARAAIAKAEGRA